DRLGIARLSTEPKSENAEKVQTPGKKSNSRRRGGSRPLIPDAPDPRHEVIGLAKAACRHAPMLLVLQLQASFRHCVVDRPGHRVASHGEHEDLRESPGHVDHRELAFPCLANPSLA